MSTGEITNEEIAVEVFGWESWANDNGMWWRKDGGTVLSTAEREEFYDYLGDPKWLGEAERICKERGWSVELQADAWAVDDDAETYWVATLWPHEVQWNTKDRDELTIADACEETLAEAWWTAILAATRADSATRAEHEEE